METALIVTLSSIIAIVALYRMIKAHKRANKLEVDIKDLQNIIYRKIEESKEQKYDIEILITKYPDHAKRKDVVKKWTERFYKRDNCTWAPNAYLQK